MTYDPETVRTYFDRLAATEWERLEASLQGRVKYAAHARFVQRYVEPKMSVLDVGCGPGRFAIDVIRLGAQVTLVDLSPVQLDLARQRLAERDMLQHVQGFHRLDVLDLSVFDDACFDAVVCFGGAISYTTSRYVEALKELVRVARPGAPVLVSVMSLFGALRLLGPLDAAAFLEQPEQHLDWPGVLAGAGVVHTRPGSKEFHQQLALFTSKGLRAALLHAGLRVEIVAASNPLVPEFPQIPDISANERAAATLLALELALSEQPGLVDAGGHLIAVARKPGNGTTGT